MVEDGDGPPPNAKLCSSKELLVDVHVRLRVWLFDARLSRQRRSVLSYVYWQNWLQSMIPCWSHDHITARARWQRWHLRVCEALRAGVVVKQKTTSRTGPISVEQLAAAVSVSPDVVRSSRRKMSCVTRRIRRVASLEGAAHANDHIGITYPKPQVVHRVAASQRRSKPNEHGHVWRENRRPAIPFDTFTSNSVWIDLFGGICPAAAWHARMCELGLLPKLQAYFCFEKDPVVRQIAMHMNPPTDYFPGITFPMDDVGKITESWLEQIPRGAILAVTAAAPCVDFSKLRLLRNYKGVIPDPALARPGLDGKNGTLTRVAMGVWTTICKRHSPFLLSENVPFQDLAADWAEVQEGWGVTPVVINSAAHAHTHRNRAWWLHPQPRPDTMNAFGPLDVDECLEPGCTLDPDSCATVTRSWVRGTDDRPEQNSERKMLVIDPDGRRRPPTVTEVERMLDFVPGSTAAPGVTVRQRMQALGNAWCYRTFHMLACAVFGTVFPQITPARALKALPASSPSNPLPQRHALTAALRTTAELGNHDPDDLDAQAYLIAVLNDGHEGTLRAVLEQNASDAARIFEDYASTMAYHTARAEAVYLATTSGRKYATIDDADELVNVTCFDSGSEGTFHPQVIVTNPSDITQVLGWTGGSVTTEGAGYLPMSLWDEEREEWFDYDLIGAERLKEEDCPEPLLAEHHLSRDWKIIIGFDGDPSYMVSRCGRRVKITRDPGGKRTLVWKLRTGPRSKPCSADISLEMADAAEKTANSNKLRTSLRNDALWITFDYLHAALVHISPLRLRWTLKRALGVSDPGPIGPIQCESCDAHKATRPPLSQKAKELKRENLQQVNAEMRQLQAVNDTDATEAAASAAIAGDQSRFAIAYSNEHMDTVETDSDDDTVGDLDTNGSSENESESGSDIDDMNEDVALTAADIQDTEDAEAEIIADDDDAKAIQEFEVLRAGQERPTLQSIPTLPRWENARPFEIMFCDFKPYKKSDKVYGGYIGEMMFADYASQLRDVIPVPRNCKRNIYEAVREFFIRHKVASYVEKYGGAGSCIMLTDGCGSNKTWVKMACMKFRVGYELIPPWAQELNEAEKVANIVWTSARALLADAKLPDSRLLPFAVRFVVQRLYISATNAERQWKSPYEIIHGKPPIIKIEDLPKFYTKCRVPSTKERMAQLATAARKKNMPFKYERAESGRYLGNEHILSKTARVQLDRTTKVVGCRRPQYQFGNDTYTEQSAPSNAAQQEITHDTLQYVEVPASLISVVPESVTIETEESNERDFTEENNSLGVDLGSCYYEDESPGATSVGDPTEDGYMSPSSPPPETGSVAEAALEMKEHSPYVQIEELRPQSEYDHPKMNIDHQHYTIEDPEKLLQNRYRPGTEERSQLETIPLGPRVRSTRRALHVSREPQRTKDLKVYHVVADFVDSVESDSKRATLECELESWYHKRLCSTSKDPNGLKDCNAAEIRRAFLAGKKAQNDMDWKVTLKDGELGDRAVIARDKEIGSLKKNILTELSPSDSDWKLAVKEATNCRLLLAIKRDGTVKCRLVKQGFRENLLLADGPDFDYSSNVIKLHSVRLALSRRRPGASSTMRRIAVRDISTAFLQSHSYPDGKVKYCKYRDPIDGEVRYYRQTGPIYGEAAAPMLWEQTVAPWIESIGFERGDNEPSVFYHSGRDLLVLLYVDDALADGEQEDVEWFFKELGKRFECKDPDWLAPGEPLDYLGMEVSIDEDYLWIGMPKYISKMVDYLGWTPKAKGSCTRPIEAKINPDGTSPLLSDADRKVFQTALGMTGWLQSTARPDISLAQSRIAQHSASPSEEAFVAVKHLVSYLWHTRDLHLRAPLQGSDEFSSVLCNPEDDSDSLWTFHSDTDHAGNNEIQNRRRSQNSRIACHNGMPVDWKSSVSSIAFACEDIGEAHADMSSGAAEIYGAANASMDCLHMRYVAEEMAFEFPKPIVLQVDNFTAQKFHSGTVKRSKLKHIDTRQEWVKVLRDKNILKVVHVPTQINIADIGTKILEPGEFLRIRGMIMFYKEK